jgi:hypothetical protein
VLTNAQQQKYEGCQSISSISPIRGLPHCVILHSDRAGMAHTDPDMTLIRPAPRNTNRSNI